MSSFSDNFTRDEKQDTQIDGSAFHTFGGTILIVTILTLLVLIYRRFFYSKELLKNHYHNCQCSFCKERVSNHYKKIRSKKINFTFYFMILSVIFLSYLFYLSYSEIVKTGNNFKKFDPYELLEISPGADEKEIKKAYRKLSLKYHPDKNRNDLQAKARFIMIAKAYEALTDEVGRKNYEMYGNPDGPGSMRLAVGLPSFVLNKKNHMPILILFLILIVVIIPGFVWFYFSTSKSYDESGTRIEDHMIFYILLNENILLRQMPYVLGSAHEYSNMKFKTNNEVLKNIWKIHTDKFPKTNEKSIQLAFGNQCAIALLYAFVTNHPFDSQEMNEDIQQILEIAPQLLLNMYKMTFQITCERTINKNLKQFGYNCYKTILEFSQLIHQKLSIEKKDSSPFQQLPHFTSERLAKFKFSNKKEDELSTLNTLQNFITKRTPEQRKQILSNEFKDSEIQDIENACKNFPIYTMKVEAFVEGFGEEILLNDLCTYRVTIDRANIEENKVFI